MIDNTATTEHLDHVLERLWVAQEDGRLIDGVQPGGSHVEEDLCGESHSDSRACDGSCSIGLHETHLVQAGLAKRDNGLIVLTSLGSARAQELIRRHRLAELLLTEVLDLPTDSDQMDVCQLEHALSPRVADRICSFLGHPPTCPHGRPIPRGPCCQRSSGEVEPLVEPLADARVGYDYKVVFIRPRHHLRLDRLAVLGITPGATIHLHQRRPSYVVKAEETELAVDSDIACDIFVRPL